MKRLKIWLFTVNLTFLLTLNLFLVIAGVLAVVGGLGWLGSILGLVDWTRLLRPEAVMVVVYCVSIMVGISTVVMIRHVILKPVQGMVSTMQRLAAGDFDLYYGEARLTADWDLGSLLDPGGRLNYGHWSNPDTSRLLAELAGAQDRTAAMRALCAHLKDQAPILPVCFKSTSVLTQAKVVEGLAPTAAEPFFALGQCAIHLKED